MNPGCIRCPKCGRPVQVKNGFVREHYARIGRPGGGFRSLSSKCELSKKRAEEL